jgi:hypothetical protein
MFSPDKAFIKISKSRRLRRTEHLASILEKRHMWGNLDRKPQRETLLARSRHEWRNNIRMGLEGLGWDDLNWINLNQ